MSAKIQRLKAAIRGHLVDTGTWEEGAVLIERQADFWNDAAIAMGGAVHGAILVIGVASGDATEEDSLESDLTLPVTILAQAVVTPGQQPEEALWEATVRALHNFIPTYEGDAGHWTRRLRYQGFTDAEELLIGHYEVAQLARQTVFKARFSLEADY
jgi:hypothetical protein